MIKLSTNYKIETARSLTELAIQNNLMSKYSNSEETAKEISKFFKTLLNELDSETNELNSDN
ncbi:hypothetical protein [Clostridium butyricum]